MHGGTWLFLLSGVIFVVNSDNEQDFGMLTSYMTPKLGAPKNINQLITNIKELISNNTIRVGDFTSQLHQWTDHSNRKSTRKQ